MEKRMPGLTGFQIKLMAVITMAADHVGKVCFPEQMWMTMVGRLAFPLFCFLLVEGFIHTGNVKKYMMRLFLFALISEIPFDLALYGKCFDPSSQNVFFTLFLGVCMLWLIQKCGIRQGRQIVIFILAVLAAFVLRTDYSGLGICFIFILYQFYHRVRFKLGLFTVVSAAVYMNQPQDMTSIISIFPMWLYNGRRGLSCKYFFYIFYPAHLMILGLIRR